MALSPTFGCPGGSIMQICSLLPLTRGQIIESIVSAKRACMSLPVHISTVRRRVKSRSGLYRVACDYITAVTPRRQQETKDRQLSFREPKKHNIKTRQQIA